MSMCVCVKQSLVAERYAQQEWGWWQNGKTKGNGVGGKTGRLAGVGLVASNRSMALFIRPNFVGSFRMIQPRFSEMKDEGLVEKERETPTFSQKCK